MKKLLALFTLLCLQKALHAQQPSVYNIKADSVKITNSRDTAELIIENHIQWSKILSGVEESEMKR